ncbi:MAG: IgGFc-binding protein, partial [Myxococcales bacterium]|nr:IgGFc-binding protein [Myxococcales bacterium]
PADSVQIIALPDVNELILPTIQQSGPSVLVPDGAYRLRSTQPVTVYQYNPLQYQVGNTFSFTNDASVLLPVNTWTGSYRVVSRNHWVIQGFNLPGFYAVTASQDGTTVTITPSATGGTVFAGGGVQANGAGVVMLDEGDVLEVVTASAGGQPDLSDLTGTLIEADKPVQVIGGHKCTRVPINVEACDHLEESIPPLETQASEYIVTAPLIPTQPMPKVEMVRVIAVEDNTMVSYDPPIGGPTMLANAGDYFEIALNDQDFQITAAEEKKIIVAQYMVGQNGGGNSGDPAMTLAVATEQFRDYYLVHAPTNYEFSYANVIAPDGATVDVDGMNIGNWTPIGNTGYSVARVTLSNAGDGNHRFNGDQKFGVSVYGYGQYTSYWYPGGQDLEVIQ